VLYGDVAFLRSRAFIGASQKQALAGDTPNLAARLQARRWNPVSAKKPVFREGGAASASRRLLGAVRGPEQVNILFSLVRQHMVGAVIKKSPKTIDSTLICDTYH
jgi:hypothetical protein